jgi:DNA polymerase III sliding clamp (beta) subunit (PCNA family)
MIFLPKHTAQVAAICGDEGGRYSLQGVHVLEYEGGHYRVEASDGHYVGIVRGVSEAVEPPAGLRDAANGCYDYIVPMEAWNAGFKLCKNPATKKDEPLSLVASADTVTMAVSDCTARADPVDGRFPDIDGVLPKAPPLFSVEVQPKLLIDLLRVAAAFAGRESPNVRVCFWPKQNLLGVMTRNESQTFDAVVVCLSPPK